MSGRFGRSPAVCFLLGLPRSGTTLLAHLLQHHPDIVAPPEPWLMLALEAFGRVDQRHPAGSSLIEAATSEFLGRIDRTIVSRAFADAAYDQYLAEAGKRIILDKTPRYWTALEFLESVYPEAPHILLMRNPYAVAASLKSTWGIPLRAESSHSVSVSSLADLMLRLPDVIISSLADLVLGLPKLAAHRTRPQTQFVHYELLVAHPDEEIRRLLTGLGCDPAAVASAGMGQADYLRSSSFGDRKILERNAVDQSSVKTWQSQLSVEEMQTVTDLVGAELLLELGYEQELLLAQQAGVLDRGREVTELYRQIFRTWWDVRSTKAGALSGPSHPGEPVHTAWDVSEKIRSACDVSKVRQANGPSGANVEENLRPATSMAAQLQQALLASEADRAAGLDAIRNRDTAIEMLRGEVARLEQILNIP
ncbi:fucosyl-beta-1,4-N-acetylglucosamine oligosaccharide 3-O-sulfotransferase NoeE [Bradyrhizobium sp. Rc2d]|uniref:nodulation protein NoeE n=1 Tax=Bradyrhizobium sp. Rc2d TaxID=1855321 RepID=UPI0008885F8E|nr:sulfotransferase [Bradyrhizobium sp. Rc2d]SDJ12431.1 fucosyl-beta-1,4-N-acetylglucosamine oligosaccharide 3-O-sulfotransferase NoeE [Bradyrhizobium sp. Rc2d]